MKKFIDFIFKSVTLFIPYFLMSLVILVVLQTVLRIFIPAASMAETIWKALYMYLMMAVVSAFYLYWSDAEIKRSYLAFAENTEWSIPAAVRYSLRQGEFWLRVVGFSIWPMIFSKYFMIINQLYIGNANPPYILQSLLCIVTVGVPYIGLSLVSWCIVLRIWYKNRLHG